jgi:hypothetical protein
VVTAKPFDISKQEVWDAYKRVKANRGAAGVDDQSIAEFEADLPNNLYKLWNRRAATFHPRGRDPEGNRGCPHAGHSHGGGPDRPERRQGASGTGPGTFVPRRLLRLSARPVSARCGRGGAPAVLAVELGA